MKLKTLIIGLIIFTVPFSVISQNYSQDNPGPSALRKFVETTNKLQIRKNIYLGKVKGQNKVDMHIWAVEYQQSDSGSVILKGVKIKIIDRRSEFKHELSALVDGDEVVECISFFNSMLNFSEEWKNEKKPLTEVVFVTKDNFKFNFIQDGKNQQSYSQIFYEDDLIICRFPSAKSKISEIKDLLDKAYLELNLKVFDKARNVQEINNIK